MREFSPETVAQLIEQLDRATKGVSSAEAVKQLQGQAATATSQAALGANARSGGFGAGGPAPSDPLRGTTPPALVAIVETAFLAAAVDGQVTPLEIAQFGEAVASVLEAHADTPALMQALGERLRVEGWDARVTSVASILGGTEHAEHAYRLAASVAFVDDHVEHAEAAALDSFARALGIEDNRAHEIMREVRAELFGD